MGGVCGAAAALALRTTLVALRSAGSRRVGVAAASAVSAAQAPPPISAPVRGSLRACMRPPRAVSVKAQRAVRGGGIIVLEAHLGALSSVESDSLIALIFVDRVL